MVKRGPVRKDPDALAIRTKGRKTTYEANEVPPAKPTKVMAKKPRTYISTRRH